MQEKMEENVKEIVEKVSALQTKQLNELIRIADKYNVDREHLLRCSVKVWEIFVGITSTKEYELKPESNADRIRSMTDEELLECIPCPYDTAGENIMPCLLGERKGDPTNEECHACMMEWLQREVE